ncbi:hypothetical protein SAMN04489729_8335 [Amycolatopsis lurida]|uniref:Uncharacterized protein n=1 Tax=Amycolatopsis lurida NRRL 2430 TaxID=1460371 RepID=A0A2P2FI65_AMYLU|nr:hypothetical protein [Amycolatopsis lurida]KFU76418.1 hypothetical protein BB31_36185 [Amycolatopsis lurida NRRL 2430]SEE61037.1 hypothetical protein SAMN04489729_8335 [Amycolatopsis lurida]
MIEILDDLDVLTRPDVDPRELSLAGACYGSKAADTVARDSVIEVTLSPIVHRSIGGSGRATEYYGADGELLSREEVVENAVETEGIVHFSGKFSYRIVGGTVSGFAFYGGERGLLAHFGHLRSRDEFLDLFGTPDLVEESVDCGELMGYRHRYRTAGKQVFWDSWDDRVSWLNIGDFDSR